MVCSLLYMLMIMKKALFALISVLAVTFSAQAQFGFGAKGGLSLTNLIGGGAPHDVMFNYHVGAFVEYRFSNHLAISPEVLFSAQGGSHKLSDFQIGDIITESTKQKWTTNYVTVPVMLKLYATDRLSIDLGPQFGFNVTSKPYPSRRAPPVKEELKPFPCHKALSFCPYGTFVLNELYQSGP